jgi:aspartate aminotransferase-like enzyme
MLPGPTTLHPRVLEAMHQDYGSGQVDEHFLPFYAQTGKKLASLMGTDNDVALMTGEGMLALWAALKSCLKPGDPVVSVGTGVFGDGIGDMAASFGCRVEKVSLPYNGTIGMDDSLQRIEEAIRRVKPVMITAVHCETPSGTLNPLAALGEMKTRLDVPLLYADAVSSLGGVPVEADAWHIDLLLAGSQKCLSAPPSMSIIAVSQAAWRHMERVAYQGYDAILPFRHVQADGRCPYTPYWHGVAALHAGASAILEEGTAKVFARHTTVADQCREGLRKLGIRLFAAPEAVCSPTVTAALIPERFIWEDWRRALKNRGLIVSGSFGPMAGKVFRLGHMGAQANAALMDKALAAIADALQEAPAA